MNVLAGLHADLRQHVADRVLQLALRLDHERGDLRRHGDEGTRPVSGGTQHKQQGLSIYCACTGVHMNLGACRYVHGQGVGIHLYTRIHLHARNQ